MFRVIAAAEFPFLPVLADAMESKGSDLAFWINYGACGIILGWTLWRAEPRLADIARAIDRLTRMICILLTELPHVIEAVKDQSKGMRRELTEAARKRGDPTSEEP